MWYYQKQTGVHKKKKCEYFFSKMPVINKPKSWEYQIRNSLQVNIAVLSGLLVTLLLKDVSKWKKLKKGENNEA